MRIRLPWMSRADRRLWRSAQTLHDLGQRVALWLTGAIASQPGYTPNYGPDPETEYLVPVLARINELGYVTDCSQPGISGADGDDHWEQRAAVSGLVDNPALLRRLVDAAEEAGLLVICHDVTPGPHPDGVAVTKVNGEDCTWFGGHVLVQDLRTIWPERIIGRRAFARVAEAWQVTIIDPQYGRDDVLWEALWEVIRQERPALADAAGGTG
ncbi:hypothetical protein AB0L49_23885 [Streptomyces antimycoticus]|uniref:DUF6919 domain-containing protein n=1 Tax=Streptomyces antimycoticus TaxID=68175 RepID=UPI0034314A9A